MWALSSPRTSSRLIGSSQQTTCTNANFKMSDLVYCGPPCVAFASHVDPGTSITILAQGPSCIIGTQYSFCGHYKMRAAERLTGTIHRSQDQGHPFSVPPLWHIGLSCKIDPGTTTYILYYHNLFPCGIRHPRQCGSACGSGAGFPLMEAYSSVWPIIRLH